MHGQRIEDGIEGYILPLRDDLLHRLMKFPAVWSIRIGEDNDLVLGRFITEHQGVLQGNF